MHLLMQLFKMEMKQGESMQTYVDRLNHAVRKLINTGFQLDDKVALLLARLTPAYSLVQDQILHSMQTVDYKKIMKQLISRDVMTKSIAEDCHFLHYVPGGYNAVAQIMNLGPAVPPPRNLAGPTPASNGRPASAVKSRRCKNFNTPEWELGTPVAPSYEEPYPLGGLPGRFMPRNEPPPPSPATGFGALASAKISVDGSLAGAIIGKGGVNSKQIRRETGRSFPSVIMSPIPTLRTLN
ncbi:hypothetical protein Droror1_Dr00012716 [Drosera rotundifolia]